MNAKICRARPVGNVFTPEEEKTATAIQSEVALEVSTLLDRVFAERKQSGRVDLEAVEMAFRRALHQSGAAAFTELLQFPEPAPRQRTIPCRCGQQAGYRGLRRRRSLTASGPSAALPSMVSVPALS